MMVIWRNFELLRPAVHERGRLAEGKRSKTRRLLVRKLHEAIVRSLARRALCREDIEWKGSTHANTHADNTVPERLPVVFRPVKDA